MQRLNSYKIYSISKSLRFAFLYIFIFFLFFLIIARIAYLQLVNSDFLLREGDMRSLRIQRVDISRGIIRDRDGRLLAISIPVCSVYANPQELVSNNIFDLFIDQRWKILSDILSIPLDQIFSHIKLRSNESFVYLARQVNLSVGEYILNLKLPGIYLRQESRRYYPCAQVTAHVLGMTDIDSCGIEGVEKTFDSFLRGRPGQRIVRQDPCGRVIETVMSIDSKSGNNLLLSIDERLQTLMYHELNRSVILHKASSGSAVLIDVTTGEILAMVNIPSYDPNNLSISAKEFIRNRAITDLFEPGSTVKPLVIMAALQQGVVREYSVLDTSPYFINGWKIKDVVNYSKLGVKDILRKSSNVGVSKLALSIPSSVLVDTYLRFGIGKKTDVGLIGENYSLSFLKNHYSDIERAVLSYGYGLMVTPLQLAKVYATIGSMGVDRPISIIRINSKVPGKQVFPSSIVKSVVNMMNNIPLSRVRSSEDIDGAKGHCMAIKTGTVKKVGKHGKYVNKYIAYTAGIAPVSDPRFSLVVMLNEPQSGQYYARIVSVPVFKKIMRGIFRIMDIRMN